MHSISICNKGSSKLSLQHIPKASGPHQESTQTQLWAWLSKIWLQCLWRENGANPVKGKAAEETLLSPSTASLFFLVSFNPRSPNVLYSPYTQIWGLNSPYWPILYLVPQVLKLQVHPGWCGSVDWVPASLWTKGCQFNSQSGHMPGLQARTPVRGTWEATTHCCFSPSLSPSFPLSLKINK